jgi:hypothetical protein
MLCLVESINKTFASPFHCDSYHSHPMTKRSIRCETPESSRSTDSSGASTGAASNAHLSDNDDNNNEDDDRFEVLETALPNYTPRDNDIVSGRGKGSLQHLGNTRYLEVLRNNLEAYMKKTKKLDKSVLIANIVKTLRKGGSRFICFDEESHCWWEIGNDKARKKTGHAVRDLLLAAGKPMKGGRKAAKQEQLTDDNDRKRISDGSTIDGQRKRKQQKPSPKSQKIAVSPRDPTSGKMKCSPTKALLEIPPAIPTSEKLSGVLFAERSPSSVGKQQPESRKNLFRSTAPDITLGFEASKRAILERASQVGLKHDPSIQGVLYQNQLFSSGAPLSHIHSGTIGLPYMGSVNVTHQLSMMNTFHQNPIGVGQPQQNVTNLNSLDHWAIMLGKQDNDNTCIEAFDIRDTISGDGRGDVSFDPLLCPESITSSSFLHPPRRQILNMGNMYTDQEYEPTPILHSSGQGIFFRPDDYAETNVANSPQRKDHFDTGLNEFPDYHGTKEGDQDDHRATDDNEPYPFESSEDWLGSD